MRYRVVYKTPEKFSNIILESDGECLTGLWFENLPEYSQNDLVLFGDAVRWLDIYFSGRDPGFTPDYRLDGLTPFQKSVAEVMLKIPYGKTTTYGAIASEIAKERGLPKMSAQAVGGAVGRNPISLIIPCHRVIGSDGSLTGYGGGLSNKEALLKFEGSLR